MVSQLMQAVRGSKGGTAGDMVGAVATTGAARTVRLNPFAQQRLGHRQREAGVAARHRVAHLVALAGVEEEHLLRLGDRVAVFANGGRLAQYATPDELMAAPADEFVESFALAARHWKARQGDLRGAFLKHRTPSAAPQSQLP